MAKDPDVGNVVMRPHGTGRGTYRVVDVDDEGVSLEGISAEFNAWVSHDSFAQDFRDVKPKAAQQEGT